jgi:hypothetical protein
VAGDRLSEMMISPNWSKSFACEAEHGLQFVSLRLKHDQANERGFPLLPLGNSINAISVRISGDLLAC